MANPTEKCQPWVVAGDPCIMEKRLIAGSQTFGVGTPVYMKDGSITQCVDSDATADKAIYGFVYAAAASPTAATEIYVARINTNQLWAIWVSSNGTDTAAALDIIGDQYGHSVETSSPFDGYMTLDLALTSHLSMSVENVMSNLDTKIVATVSTAPGVAIVRYLQAALDQVGP